MIATTRFAQWLGTLLVSCGVAWIATAAHGEAVLGAQADRVDLWPEVRVLPDPSRAVSVEQAYASRAQFSPPRGAYSTLGMDKEVVWLHVPLSVAGGGQGAWILNLDYALLHRVDIFLLRDGRVVRQATLGNTQPFSARPLRSRSHAVPLEFTTGGAADLLLRVDTPGDKILPITLSRL